MPDASDTRDRPAVADREALARHAADERFPAGRAEQDDVADNDVVLRGEPRRARRTQDEPTAGQSLSDVIVGFPLQTQRHTTRKERAEALARRAGAADRYRVVGQPASADQPRHFRTDR